jgi:hypothetical protein
MYFAREPRKLQHIERLRDENGNWRTWGMDMRHKRRDILPDSKPCDVGMFGDAAKQSALF